MKIWLFMHCKIKYHKLNYLSLLLHCQVSTICGLWRINKCWHICLINLQWRFYFFTSASSLHRGKKQAASALPVFTPHVLQMLNILLDFLKLCHTQRNAGPTGGALRTEAPMQLSRVYSARQRCFLRADVSCKPVSHREQLFTAQVFTVVLLYTLHFSPYFALLK